MALRMSQMLRSSRDLRSGRARSVVLDRPPAPPAPAEDADEPMLAAVDVVPEPPPAPEKTTETAPASSAASSASLAYDALVEAANELFAAAREDRAPNGPLVVAAVRGVVNEFSESDALLTETVRRRPEAQSEEWRSVNVAVMAMRLGREVELDERRTLALGLCSLTHDLGMLKVPQEVLESRRLTSQQLAQLQQHPAESERIVRGFGKAFEWVGKVVVQCHERRDGSGYPKGLQGDDIHGFARIIGLVDTYEAMAQPRADRQARVIYNALKEIIDLRNSLFARRLIKALINIVSIFPLGSLVKLNNGEIGRVVATSRLHPTRPTIDVLVDPRGRKLGEAKQINLQEEPMLYIVDPAIEEGVLDGR
jgi:HD-GYP domain-containing protein (c-di-GMP phosphodiesterase class II)